MASITHLVLGAAAGQHLARKPSLWPMLALSFLSFCPDLDVISFKFGIPYASPFGHRGFTHSISFALVIGLGVWGWKAWSTRSHQDQQSPVLRSPLYWGMTAMLVTLSHPILDAFTTGGLGVALWWPISKERIFFSPQIIPVSPIGLKMLSSRGAYVLAVEMLICIPFWIYMIKGLIQARQDR